MTPDIRWLSEWIRHGGWAIGADRGWNADRRGIDRSGSPAWNLGWIRSVT
jgi:hypothetical protein